MGMSETRSEEHLDLSASENNDVILRRDVGISMRENGNGYPIKRFHSNGLDLHQEAQKVSGVVKGGRLHGSGRKSGSSWLCSVLICIVIMCFLTQSLLQDTLTTFIGPIESSRPGYSHEVEVDLSQSLENDNNVNLSALANPAYFGDNIKFMPSKNLGGGRNLQNRHGEPHVHPIRHPRLAIVCSDLSRSPGLLFLFTVATSLQALGYDLELFSLEDGPMHAVWENLRTSVNILQGGSEQEVKVDWLSFDGVFVNSLDAKIFVSSLRLEPFNAVPLIWAIHENELGIRLKEYTSSQQMEILNDWKETFHRADVVVFDDYTKPMIYSALDSGNFVVIPGSPIETWEVEHFMATQKKEDLRKQLGFNLTDFVIVVVGSPFIYKGIWLEHTLVMQAMLPLLSEFNKDSDKDVPLKLVIMSGNSSTYGTALQAVARQLGFPIGSIQHVGVDGHENIILRIADLVIYSSLHEEQAFPAILLRAMAFEKPIIAPNLTMIQKYIKDGKHGLLFPVGNVNMMTKAMSLAIWNGGLSFLARQIASAGRLHERNVMASDVIVGYATLVENVLQFPSEALLPLHASQLPEKVKKEWQWELFTDTFKSRSESLHQSSKKHSVIFQVEALWRNWHHMAKSLLKSSYRKDETIDLPSWEEERANEIAEGIKIREEAQLEERNMEPKHTWEDLYRAVKRIERTKDELHERDDGELERTGQPLCIYEPYHGHGTLPFLHHGALYRGIGLAKTSFRNGTDDVDATARLPLLNDAYYRDALCEYGAYFAIANRVDQIHKNPWIGFQSWRAAGKKVSLSAVAEKELINAVTTARHGNAVYFWVRMDKNVGHTTQGSALQQKDFWSFCDAINAGNCRTIFTDAFKNMYNLPETWTGLPPMPLDGDSWSVLHSWAMPTSSFLELVMFARIFVDSIDAQHYEEHRKNSTCCLSVSKMENQHCYCRLLELLVNVWAYHSARKMVYVNPETGLMLEQHRLENRKGQMWVKWFNISRLKAMDEDLAEVADYEQPAKRWLWPRTGEIFWQGIYERERQQQYRLKMSKRRRSKQKIDRMRSKYRQKALGKYRKPPLPEVGNRQMEDHPA
ncbi:uncharacterized protein LOC131076577 [Cryptomeria japonica]|uniref:uncharacterized protein LOC131076577 n=1 Tax=Cryptomeria japonica TaxID=3369 RepID=UPI0027DA3B25|nr:uncharacterized protein LOC131076577 [Cryptomeria japonica]